jgi:hypothetical protein
MKQVKRGLLERLGLISKKQEPAEQSHPVLVTSYSQPHVLQHYMKEKDLSHGDRVIADIGPVRLESHPFHGSANIKPVIYFCPIQSIDIKTRLNDGDGGTLPVEATLNGIRMGEGMAPGLYMLRNVELYSNGTLQVNATAKTEFESI